MCRRVDRKNKALFVRWIVALSRDLAAGFIGSRQSTTLLWPTADGVLVQCGCYLGSLAEFAVQVKEKHGDNQYAKEYAAAIEFAEACFAARKK